MNVAFKPDETFRNDFTYRNSRRRSDASRCRSTKTNTCIP